MNFTITTAKTLFNYDSADDTAISTALTNAIPSAKAQLRQLIGADEYNRYFNNANSITATSKNSDNITFNLDNHIFKASDIVVLDSKQYIITSITDDAFTIDKEYDGSSLIFTLNTLSDYELLFANCLVYQFTFTGRELIYKQILSDNQQFGDGAIRQVLNTTRQSLDPIANLRKEILQNMEIILSPYESIIEKSSQTRGEVIR